MRFPEKITVVAQNASTGMPVEAVAVVLVLFAARKNDYYIGPSITNAHGEVEFTRAECQSAIKRQQEIFIMDYAGDLESCRPVIEIRLHPPERIKRMLQQYKESPDFWGQGFADPKRLFSDLQNVKNSEYEPARITATEQEIFTEPRIIMSLVKAA